MRPIVGNLLALLIGIVTCWESKGQALKLETKKDTLVDDGFFLNYLNYKRKISLMFKIGQTVERHLHEPMDAFVSRTLGASSHPARPAMEIPEWKYAGGRPILTFQTFVFHKVFRQGQIEKQESIVGLLLVPVDKQRHYLIVKVNEIMTSGGDIGIKAVFLANADKTKEDKELAIMVTETFHKHGTVFETYFYPNQLCGSKLTCLGNLTEHCDYSMVKKGDTWDYQYKEEALPTKYIDCSLNTTEKVLAALKCGGL